MRREKRTAATYTVEQRYGLASVSHELRASCFAEDASSILVTAMMGSSGEACN